MSKQATIKKLPVNGNGKAFSDWFVNAPVAELTLSKDTIKTPASDESFDPEFEAIVREMLQRQSRRFVWLWVGLFGVALAMAVAMIWFAVTRQ